MGEEGPPAGKKSEVASLEEYNELNRCLLGLSSLLEKTPARSNAGQLKHFASNVSFSYGRQEIDLGAATEKIKGLYDRMLGLAREEKIPEEELTIEALKARAGGLE